ncbi:hypothetical protein CLCR_11039 [Cladophialophora carrionii]|uniref:Uncharacterized protein n=1 Tax=Cladophialophora carrionii TaxID=86049 RepID=A0A1C1CXR3_9EURO|nr:hypothetical protein CLCR_11039 [Cladophialophora carrionii]
MQDLTIPRCDRKRCKAPLDLKTLPLLWLSLTPTKPQPPAVGDMNPRRKSLPGGATKCSGYIAVGILAAQTAAIIMIIHHFVPQQQLCKQANEAGVVLAEGAVWAFGMIVVM